VGLGDDIPDPQSSPAAGETRAEVDLVAAGALRERPWITYPPAPSAHATTANSARREVRDMASYP
jgi:hypothetical protein